VQVVGVDVIRRPESPVAPERFVQTRGPVVRQELTGTVVVFKVSFIVVIGKLHRKDETFLFLFCFYLKVPLKKQKTLTRKTLKILVFPLLCSTFSVEAKKKKCCGFTEHL
jgi:hypothetical protein